jgi:two-component system, NarL family, response regulator YdfI
MSATQDSPRSDLGSLSLREVEVLDLIASGLTNTDVASRLNVTVHTVKFHLASIYRKLGVANRTQAVGTYLRRVTP